MSDQYTPQFPSAPGDEPAFRVGDAVKLARSIYHSVPEGLIGEVMTVGRTEDGYSVFEVYFPNAKHPKPGIFGQPGWSLFNENLSTTEA